MKRKLTQTLSFIQTDQLWPLIVLAGFLFFVSLVPLPPNDFWWHLKIGEIIYSEVVNYRRFPEDLFAGSDEVRRALRALVPPAGQP